MSKDTLKNILASIHFPELNSFLLYQKDEVILEQYFNGFSTLHLHEAQSVTKSIQAILVGIALDLGFLEGVDTKIKDSFPEYKHLDWSNGKADITLRHLLTMTAGLNWNESKVPYHFVDLNDSNLMAESNDWLSFALSKEMVDKIGEKFNYSSAAPILISKILKAATAMSNESFAKRYLFGPLGIAHYWYYRDETDEDILADIYLLPQDLLKLGILMLKKGNWQGRQIVSEEWVHQSTQPHIQFNEMESYGYFWWRKVLEIKGQQISCYYAWGCGGQHIFVVPSLDLVMVTTARKYDITLAKEPFELLEMCLNIVL